jgi:hypothetical protein
MKKIYIVLNNLEEVFLGYSDSLKDWFFHAEKRDVIIPLHGKENYTIIHNMYNDAHDQYVTYKAV